MQIKCNQPVSLPLYVYVCTYIQWIYIGEADYILFAFVHTCMDACMHAFMYLLIKENACPIQGCKTCHHFKCKILSLPISVLVCNN